MQRDVLPSPDAHAQSQPVESIEPSASFAIHQPSLAAQKYPYPQVPKPWSGMSKITNPHP